MYREVIAVLCNAVHASRTRLRWFSNGASTPSRCVLCTRSTRRSPAGSTARAFSPVVSAGERPQVKVVWRRAHLCSVACRGRCVRAPPCPVPVIFFSRVRHRAVRAVTFGRYLRLQKPVRFFFFFFSPFCQPCSHFFFFLFKLVFSACTVPLDDRVAFGRL